MINSKASEIISKYSGKFVTVELLDGRKFQGKFFGTGPVVNPNSVIPQSESLIFDKIDDIDEYNKDILKYKIRNEYFSPSHIRSIELIS